MTDFVHNYGGDTKISVQGIREIKTAPTTNLGSVKPLVQGREVVYAKLSTAAHSAGLVPGMVMMAPVEPTTTQRMAVALTASIGAREVTVVAGALSASQDEFAGGFLHIESGTGVNYSYMVEGNAAFAASSTAAKILLKDGLEVALNTASIASLYHNIYRNVAVKPDSAAITSIPVGVLLVSCALTNGGYVYLGKKGIWPARIEGTEVTGQPVRCGSANGTVNAVGTADTVFHPVGRCVITAAASGLVDFQL
jgi:hypothetical protein